MRKILIFAGHEGALGRGIHTVLSGKDYDEIILLSSRNSAKNSVRRERPDLANGEVVSQLFAGIKSSSDTHFFLFSAIGGFSGGKAIWESGTDSALEMMNKNYVTSYNLLAAFTRLVKESAGGSVIFVSAWSGGHPDINRAAYASSKAALNHLIKSAALEGKEINLSVCGIAPYLIDTPANREWMPEERWGTMQKPEEVGELVHQIFRFSHILSGNIIELGERLQLLNFHKAGE